MKKTLFFLFLGLFIIVVIYGIKAYNKLHRDLTNTPSADFKISTNALVKDFNTNEQAASAKYVDKIIEVRGKVSKSTLNNGEGIVILGNGTITNNIICHLSSPKYLEVIEIGQTITIKGICTGFLLDVVLTQSVVIK